MLKAVVKELNATLSVDKLFYQLSEGGSLPGSLLYESQDEFGAYTGFSIGIFKPSVCLSGKGEQFSYDALDQRGQAILASIKQHTHAVEVKKTKTRLHGKLSPDLSQTYLPKRLAACNHMQLVRALLLPIEVEAQYAHLPLGAFGGFAYDFIRQFEAIPQAKSDKILDDDYCFYLATRLFIIDYNTRKSYLISLIPNAASFSDAQTDIDFMLAATKKDQPISFKPVAVGDLKSDTNEAQYLKTVATLKEHIYQGDIFQAVYGRMQSATFSGDAYKVYTALKNLNPSPYMFYMRDHHGVLLGCSPELHLSVKATDAQEREVAITPIAGTKPRGFRQGSICPELDQRYAIALQTDEKELAEHVMLIDLARNDIASIAKIGTTIVTNSFAIKKYSHVQHLVSRVAGHLKEEVDALTAYLATMNMGTLTGAPKVKAMQLIAGLEENDHGYFGGGIGFVTHDGNMETAIVIRSMRVKNEKVYLRAGAGIVADSVPENEWLETEAKMQACVRALNEAVKHD